MKYDERIWAVEHLLSEYVRSPSLRHLRDEHSVHVLAQSIVKTLDRSNSIWKKWDGQREQLLKSAIPCWIPIEDLQTFLNNMPGPTLTKTDVEQRLRVLEEEDHWDFPIDELKAGCLAIFDKEKATGTELPAIINLLREHIECERERLRVERHAHWEEMREKDRIAREQRLLSGADCPWTPLRGSQALYCRVNGRTYRLTPTTDKLWHLFRIETVPDEVTDSPILGRYQRRGDATKAVAKMAYQPEARW